MKGIVFTQFLEAVEQRYGDLVLDRVLIESGIPNAGAYTAVGSYPHEELQTLVTHVARVTGISAQQVLEDFGKSLFPQLVAVFPELAVGYGDTFALLLSVENVIHQEVLKLYPDADLPRLEVKRESEDVMTVSYSSRRCMARFAFGMIKGCIAHFGESIEATVTADSQNDEALFRLVRKGAAASA